MQFTTTLGEYRGPVIEKINENDALFLLALNASEESSINEIKSDFDKWDASDFKIPVLLESHIREGVVLFGLRDAEKTTDYSEQESLDFVLKYESVYSSDVILSLTDSGYERWEKDSWGITTERARYLMFSAGGKTTHKE